MGCKRQTNPLTNGTDTATANIFNAPMVYNPAGDDRILSLQDEDVLTGLAGRTDNTLNATIGQINVNEGTSANVTPELKNIQVLNLDWTGSTTTLDVRYADSLSTINVNKATNDGNVAIINNINTAAANLRVANTANVGTTVAFNYQQGVLAGEQTANIELTNVYANTITQEALGAGAGVEGFEKANINSTKNVDINQLTVNQLTEATITGSGSLKIANLTNTVPAGVGATAPEFIALGVGVSGITDPGAVGLLKIDAAAYTGNLTLDVTAAVGGFNDPANSGAPVRTVITGGTGNDTFWTSNAIGATTVGTTTVRDVIDGGTGVNTIKTLSNIAANANGNVADIKNIQTLELRQQVGAQTVDFDAFDANLANVVMRDENSNAAAATFTLNDLGATLAGNGKLVLKHSVSETVAGTDAVVVANLKDGSGATDTVALTVQNDLNVNTQFDYTLTAGGTAATNKVENVTLNDNDTESNIATLTNAQYHTGTVTLTGGTALKTFTVANALVAATVDGSTQLSDLRLSMGDTLAPVVNVDQAIKLGQGNDILTFVNVDDFNNKDSITDAGGNDVVRAAFSKDSSLTLTDIEGLHIIANENVSLGMANAKINSLVMLADIAADGDADNSSVTPEPFNVAGVAVTDVVTLTDTNLTALNFFADLDRDDDNTVANRTAATAAAQAAATAAGQTWTGIGSSVAGDAAYKLTINDESTVANFNGVTLANNTATALTVNINASLDDAIYGATAYNLGQLTAHGVTSMAIVVANEDVTAGLGTNALTTINNIYAKNMSTLTIEAKEDVTLNTVSGAALNNSLTTLDASKVGGELTATVISLGDGAQVTLANGNNVFSALGSAGKGIKINAGTGNNTITGSAQSDTITTSSGNDTIAGDRGDNVITSGAGDDTLSAKDGNDTYDVGTGINTVTDNVGTSINGVLATNTVSAGFGATSVQIASAGVGVTTDQYLAVGNGSQLTLSWTGDTLLTASAVLDGRLAGVGSGAVNGDANANLQINNAAALLTFNGGAGNDVALVTNAGGTLTFVGGAGNDAAVGGVGVDNFTGGAGADVLVLQNTRAADAAADTVNIADGESTASAYDLIVGYVSLSDILNLDTTTVAAAAANVNGTNAGKIQSHTITGANGAVTFDIDDTNAFAAVNVGTAATGQVTLADALAYLATNLNGTSATVTFQYDKNGDGAFTAADSTFVFQDGASDTVVELAGLYTGVNATAGAGLITLA